MNIPTFHNDHDTIPTIISPACEFDWEGHAIKLQRCFYFDDRTFMADIEVFVDGTKVSVDEYLYCDESTNPDEGYCWTEHAYGIHSFSAFVANYEEEPDEEFGEILERIVKWHLASTKRVADF